MDRVSPEARSRIMSLVKSRHGRTTEKRFRAYLVSRGIGGWRMNDPSLPGKPDFVFRREMIVVFVDGCFWHGCRRCKRPPRSRVAFWLAKFAENRRRDRAVALRLRRAGWLVLRVRECDLKNSTRARAVLANLESLRSGFAAGRLLRQQASRKPMWKVR